MKIRELIDDLAETLIVEGDVEVVLSKDAEGNDFHLLSSLGMCIYNTESGEFLFDDGEDFNPNELLEDESNVQALVLWP